MAGRTSGGGRPDLHRMHARRRWRSPTEAQAQRGSKDAAGPEPISGSRFGSRVREELCLAGPEPISRSRFGSRVREELAGSLLPLSLLWYPTERRLRFRWGRRPRLRPGEATGTPPGPNQDQHAWLAPSSSCSALSPFLPLTLWHEHGVT